MKEKDLLAMNLQFFAEDSEDEGVNETEPAEQSEFESEDAEPTGEEVQEEPAAPQFDTDRANAAFASSSLSKISVLIGVIFKSGRHSVSYGSISSLSIS